MWNLGPWLVVDHLLGTHHTSCVCVCACVCMCMPYVSAALITVTLVIRPVVDVLVAWAAAAAAVVVCCSQP